MELMNSVEQTITSKVSCICDKLRSKASTPKMALPSIKQIVGLVLTFVVSLADAAPAGDPSWIKRLKTKVSCTMPDNLREQLIKTAGMENMKFLSVPVGAPMTYVKAPGGVNGIIQVTDDDRDKSCPTKINTLPSAPLEARAICPWVYVPNKARNRFPEVIPVAEGRCTGQTCPGQSDARLSCQPVMRTVTVLERTGCANGLYTFQPKEIMIPVASVCAGQRIQMQTNAPPASAPTTVAGLDYD